MNNNKKNILLVGGTGYLGRHLRNSLFFHNLYFTSTSGKENSIQLDLLDKKTFDNVKIVEHFDLIFILASTLQGLGTTELKDEYIQMDTIGLSSFLQYLSDNKLSKKIIYTSSMTVYGIDNILPVKEDAKLIPLSTYGFSKLLGEETVNFYCQHNDANGVILRIPGIYGGDRKAGYIYNTAVKCLKNEPIILDTSSLGYWETINVNDLSEYIKEFIENYDWKAKVDIFNISYGGKTDFIECATIIKDHLNSASKIEIKGKKGYVDFYLDSSKAKKIISIKNNYLSSLTDRRHRRCPLPTLHLRPGFVRQDKRETRLAPAHARSSRATDRSIAYQSPSQQFRYPVPRRCT